MWCGDGDSGGCGCVSLTAGQNEIHTSGGVVPTVAPTPKSSHLRNDPPPCPVQRLRRSSYIVGGVNDHKRAEDKRSKSERNRNGSLMPEGRQKDLKAPR